ncbi:MAG TPA: hypothetical protein VM577_01750 [Anaerovoracaceae bacterium]|nr:hypothetical protein [Anaerovoracaceae bacterium]
MAVTNQDSDCITYGQMNLINNLRMHWMEFIMWSRALITSEASGFGDLEAVGLKLYQIPSEFGNSFELFFGQEIANEMARLFTNQLLLGVDIIRAQKKGDTDAVDAGISSLYQNGNEISAYLAQINPYWDSQTWSDLFTEFLRTKIFETLAIATGRYNESIVLSGNLQYQALRMADYMAEGFIRYF